MRLGDEGTTLHPILRTHEQISGYRLVKRLGRGGVAEVWEAESPGGYRVAFPAQPIEDGGRNVDTTIGAVKMRTSAVEIDGKIFMTIDSVYPSNLAMGDPESDLDIVRDGGVQNVNGKLKAATSWHSIYGVEPVMAGA